MMLPKILCPFHEESTPSCVIYHDGFCCYGCGKRGPLSLVGIAQEHAPKEMEPEDLDPVLQYVARLPRKEVRGLSFPCDSESYWLVWPTLDYYKRRFFNPTGPKYIGSRGHKKPLFKAQTTDSRTLVLVEGEINALSIAKACPELSVFSPGGCGDFSAKRLNNILSSIIQYDTVLVVADRDEPGAKAVMEALGFLQAQGKSTKWKLMAPDANEILVEVGRDELRAEIIKSLG